jgi:hypothetical protein
MYNQIAGKRLPRIEALSDGVFSIAMTFLHPFLSLVVIFAIQLNYAFGIFNHLVKKDQKDLA